MLLAIERGVEQRFQLAEMVEAISPHFSPGSREQAQDSCS
jgi:hypothetical protein